jgi:pyruvate/2-oxoglutarate dehydrogenase complex dihydrolipoamide dehydrogenase (E3) component
MTTSYDAIVIGTGQAGPPLARRLIASGMSVAIVERHRFGGTCVNTGCIPTKAMVASAYAAYVARRAGEYGVTIGGGIGVDLDAVQARKETILAASRDGLEANLRGLERCTVYDGHARFQSAHDVSVGDSVLRAERIFINVGGRASVPPIPGVDRVPYLTNSSMMTLTELPGHLIVVGGRDAPEFAGRLAFQSGSGRTRSSGGPDNGGPVRRQSGRYPGRDSEMPRPQAAELPALAHHERTALSSMADGVAAG